MTSPDKWYTACPGCAKTGMNDEFITTKMGEVVLKGYLPTGMSCGKCCLPVMQYKNSTMKRICILCGDLGPAPADIYSFKIGQRVIVGDRVVSEQCSFCHVGLVLNASTGNLDCVLCGNQHQMMHPNQFDFGFEPSSPNQMMNPDYSSENHVGNSLSYPNQYTSWDNEQDSPIRTSGDFGTINEVPDELVNQMSELKNRLSQEDLSPEEQGEISIKLQELAEQMGGASTSGDFGTVNEVPDELVNQMSDLEIRLSEEDLSPEEQGEISIK